MYMFLKNAAWQKPYPHLADFGLAEYKKDLKRVSVDKWKSTGKPTGFELISVTPYCTNFSWN